VVVYVPLCNDDDLPHPEERLVPEGLLVEVVVETDVVVFVEDVEDVELASEQLP
jgi:hypothetical protein